MQQIDKNCNLYQSTQKELSKLGYTKIDTSSAKDYPRIGDYLLIESFEGIDRWALIGSKFMSKCSFSKETKDLIIYRKNIL